MSMAEREKDQLMNQLRSENFHVLDGKKPSQNLLLAKTSSVKTRTTNDGNRRILHEYKDKINLL